MDLFQTELEEKCGKTIANKTRIYVNKSLSERVVFSKTTGLTTW